LRTEGWFFSAHYAGTSRHHLFQAVRLAAAHALVLGDRELMRVLLPALEDRELLLLAQRGIALALLRGVEHRRGIEKRGPDTGAVPGHPPGFPSSHAIDAAMVAATSCHCLAC
jgi:hypothetical protein